MVDYGKRWWSLFIGEEDEVQNCLFLMGVTKLVLVWAKYMWISHAKKYKHN